MKLESHRFETYSCLGFYSGPFNGVTQLEDGRTFWFHTLAFDLDYWVRVIGLFEPSPWTEENLREGQMTFGTDFGYASFSLSGRVQRFVEGEVRAGRMRLAMVTADHISTSKDIPPSLCGIPESAGEAEAMMDPSYWMLTSPSLQQLVGHGYSEEDIELFMGYEHMMDENLDPYRFP